MDLLAPCRSCLQCLPFFQVSPASPPQLGTSAAAGEPSSDTPQEAASTMYSASSHPGNETKNAQSPPTPDALLEQDLPTSGKDEETDYPTVESSVILENEALPVSQIVVTPPVSSPPFGYLVASTHNDGDTSRPPELPLNVPFINDISFSSSGLVPLQSPMTPAPLGVSYDHSSGKYHPSPQIYPTGFDSSNGSKEHLHQEHGSSDLEHVSSQSGHGHLHGHSHHGHVPSHAHSQYGLESSENNHFHVASSPPRIASATTSAVGVTDETLPRPSLETTISTPEYLGVEAKYDGQNVGAISEEPALIESYNSEPIALSEMPDDDGDDDDDYLHVESLGPDPLHPGRPGWRRHRFKEKFKGIHQQIKQGRHHLKEEGSKHLQTIIQNINKQAQQIEQSGSFSIVPRGVKHSANN